MLSSMTGFATKTTTITISGEKVNVSISLKSLNSRFFETTCKLPSITSHLETDIIKMLQQKLIRGHIYLTLHIKNTALLKSLAKANLVTIKSYLDAIENIKKNFNLKGEVNINDIINLPNAFEIEEQESSKAFDKQIMDIVAELIEQLKKTRETEGLALKKDIIKQISSMTKEIESISKNSEKLMEQKKEEILTLIKKIESEEPAENASDLRKSHLLITLDKLDINEEIVRFKSHLENMTNLLESQKDEAGKKIDFTLQEMAREINTITAKCSNAKISGKAINIKVEIEKAREQSQNIV
ncbi:MAG: TIGR00255 family protein [candidate division TM6 bacterium GW2011_GWF2_30_66]|nr:MAG: TIGR00255 family protein [candidate division TM6 bacterium GW2011_GWF2_30_66]